MKIAGKNFPSMGAINEWWQKENPYIKIINIAYRSKGTGLTVFYYSYEK